MWANTFGLVLVFWGLASAAWYGGWAGWAAMTLGMGLCCWSIWEAWRDVG